jgi:hypothetical protein
VIEYNVCRSVQKCVIIMVMESVREKCNKVGIRALVRGSKHDIYSGVKLHPTPHDSTHLLANPVLARVSEGSPSA